MEEIRKANELGVICGVTTNPSLIAKEGKAFEKVVKEIANIVDGPISAEVIALDANEMVKEARPKPVDPTTATKPCSAPLPPSHAPR